MIKGLFILLFSFYAFGFWGQEYILEKNHQDGLNKAKSGDYQGAVEAFTKAIEVQPLDGFTWYNRAMAKNMMGLYLEAIDDFNACIGISPTYKKVWYNRGLTKLYLTNYDGALADFSQAIQLDREYAEAYLQRATVYEWRGLYEFACTDYRNAMSKGQQGLTAKVKACQDTSYSTFEKNMLLYLDVDKCKKTYGRQKKCPIQVGSENNMSVYLRLLRGKNGEFIPYRILKTGPISEVEISVPTKKKGIQKTLIYFDCVNFDRPLVLKGFTTFIRKKS